MSSTIVHQTQGAASLEAPLTGRNAHRYDGWLIAIGVSLSIWGLVGATIWGIVSLVS